MRFSVEVDDILDPAVLVIVVALNFFLVAHGSVHGTVLGDRNVLRFFIRASVVLNGDVSVIAIHFDVEVGGFVLFEMVATLAALLLLIRRLLLLIAFASVFARKVQCAQALGRDGIVEAIARRRRITAGGIAGTSATGVQGERCNYTKKRKPGGILNRLHAERLLQSTGRLKAARARARNNETPRGLREIIGLEHIESGV